MSVRSMNVGLLRRGSRNSRDQVAANARVVLWPSFSMSGDKCIYCGNVFAFTSRSKSLKLKTLASRVPLKLMLSNDMKGLQIVSICVLNTIRCIAFSLVLPNIIPAYSIRPSASRAHISRSRQSLKIPSPRNILRIQEIHQRRHILRYPHEIVMIQSEVIPCYRSNIIRLTWMCEAIILCEKYAFLR